MRVRYLRSASLVSKHVRQSCQSNQLYAHHSVSLDASVLLVWYVQFIFCKYYYNI